MNTFLAQPAGSADESSTLALLLAVMAALVLAVVVAGGIGRFLRFVATGIVLLVLAVVIVGTVTIAPGLADLFHVMAAPPLE